MASGHTELERQGGRANSDTGMQMTTTDFDRIGGQALQTFLHWLMLFMHDTNSSTPANHQPQSGFPRPEYDTDHCVVTATGNLDFEISTGWGMFYDSSELGSDEWFPTAYRPIVVDAVHAASLAAHDATNPRIDIVCLAPEWEEDEAATRNVKNPSTGVITTPSINQRVRFSSSVTVVTGTPGATPAAPATPAGHIRIASALVPATAGAATWFDERPVLTMGPLFRGVPATHTSDFVPEGESFELLVEPQSTPNMSVKVREGRAYIGGSMFGYRRTPTLTIAAAHATLERIDTIVAVAGNGSAIAVRQGANAAVGAAVPATPTAGDLALAYVQVDPTVTSIPGAKITDIRVREPFSGALLQDLSTNYSKMEFVPPNLEVIGITQTPGTFTAAIEFDLKRPDGTQYNVARDAQRDLYFTARAYVAMKPADTADTDYDQPNPHTVQYIRDRDNTLQDGLGFSLEGNLEPWDAYDITNDSVEVWLWELTFKIPEDEEEGPWTINLHRQDDTAVVDGVRCMVKIQPAQHMGGGWVAGHVWT